MNLWNLVEIPYGLRQRRLLGAGAAAKAFELSLRWWVAIGMVPLFMLLLWNEAALLLYSCGTEMQRLCGMAQSGAYQECHTRCVLFGYGALSFTTACMHARRRRRRPASFSRYIISVPSCRAAIFFPPEVCRSSIACLLSAHRQTDSSIFVWFQLVLRSGIPVQSVRVFS